MITFTMLVTIWVGSHTYKFNVFTEERFHGGACVRAANDLAAYIEQRAGIIKGGRIKIDRECFYSATRPA